ncbi:GlsB/YeaQ/YmgE family stress response membrane protein [Dyella acidisoli]|uniref:GlsB/YeaQ/YmgE family stress response membrane protein n=1 Tax=Dyella acidisoli TaxID=1867834 RepID=A0ABQ5XKR6_9GAMM|nr:GlsB/YeaQ/YmgE family stress response membrane protein [Dyella acidisoli]GLQ91688.1 hypothetical protein GCM10007901_06380 [Dyella acidisoli]
MEHSIVAWLVIGGAVGWISGLSVHGLGWLVDVVAGMLGGCIGGAVSCALHMSWGGPLLSMIITALLGAIIVLAVLQRLRRA